MVVMYVKEKGKPLVAQKDAEKMIVKEAKASKKKEKKPKKEDDE